MAKNGLPTLTRSDSAISVFRWARTSSDEVSQHSTPPVLAFGLTNFVGGDEDVGDDAATDGGVVVVVVVVDDAAAADADNEVATSSPMWL